MSFRLEGVRLRAGAVALIDGLSLSIAPGEVATVMGPSGAGKSSLLAYACGVLPRGLTGTGQVFAGADELTARPAHKRRLGILYQDDLLFPHLSVGGNLAFGLVADVRGRADRRLAVEAALEEAELGGMADRDPATLSGGQRARVALMRVLLSRPRALLLDEPFAKLDSDLRARFRRMVLDKAAARGLPVLLVSHDTADAAGEIIRLGAGGSGLP